MRLLLDAHLSARIAAVLRERGFDVIAAEEAGLKFLDDAALWESARGQERAIVTCDVTDYTELYAELWEQGISHPGLVVVSTRRLPTSDIGSWIRALEHLLTSGQVLTDRLVFLEPAGDGGSHGPIEA